MKYVPLTPSQALLMNKLGSFYDPTAAILKKIRAPQNEDTKQPTRYIPVMALLTDEQKAEITKRGKEIEEGFKTYSAY